MIPNQKHSAIEWQWIRWEEDLVCPKPGGMYSLNSTYFGFSIVAWAIASGTLEARDPYLIALTPEAERFSSPGFDSSNPENVRLIPLSPLHKAQQTNAKIRFYCTYNFGEEESRYQVRIHSLRKGEVFKTWSAPLKNNIAEISIPGPLTLGDADMQVDFYKDGKRLKYLYYRFHVVKNNIPETGKQLNNCVRELYSGVMPADGLKFHLNDWQWILVSFPGMKEGTVVQIDGQQVKLFGDGFLPEAMRLLANGDHTIQLPQGVTSPVILRTIPEILMYPFKIADHQNLDRSEFGVDYFRKHIWHACNVHNLGTSTSPYNVGLFAEVEERGAKILQCSGLNGDEFLIQQRQLLEGCGRMVGQYGEND